jgi:hypothetical protein
MIFLTTDDLKAHSFEKYLNESFGDFETAREICEVQGIAEIRSKLNARYDCNEIFNKSGENRHPLIVKVLSIIVIHSLLSRNSARKFKEESDLNYKWAIGWLKDVRDNKENPEGLPLKTTDGATGTKRPIWGNNSNENYYL